MTDGERIAIAFVASLVVHWAALEARWGATSDIISASDDMFFVEADVSGPEVGMSLEAPLILEQAQQVAPSNDAVADRRRAALSDYLDSLSESIHARRHMAGGGNLFIGNAVFRIVIDETGTFSQIVLLRGSGDANLDQDAAEAVSAASGSVPRPKILGHDPMVIALAVKYQLGL